MQAAILDVVLVVYSAKSHNRLLIKTVAKYVVFMLQIQVRHVCINKFLLTLIMYIFKDITSDDNSLFTIICYICDHTICMLYLMCI